MTLSAIEICNIIIIIAVPQIRYQSDEIISCYIEYLYSWKMISCINR